MICIPIVAENIEEAKKDIAKAVKLPPQTTTYRIKKLEDQKIIKKYTVNINYSKIGFSRHSLYLDLKNIWIRKVRLTILKEKNLWMALLLSIRK